MRKFCILIFALAVFMAKAKTEFEYRLWFDRDFENVKNGHLDQSLMRIDASGLSYGLHILNLQLIDSGTNSSGLRSRLFYYPSPETPKNAALMTVYVDNREFADYPVSSASPVGLNLDMQSLGCGLHTISCVFKGSAGNAVGSSSSLFLIPDPEDAWPDPSKMTVYIDNREFADYPLSSGSPVGLNLDTRSLSGGLHTISCVFKSSAGNAVGTRSAIFFIPDPEDTRLTSYAYWLDYDGATATVEPSLSGSGISLATAIAMPELPFRSRMLNCDVTNEEIKAFPVYEFNFAAFDGDKRMDYVKSEFADRRVSVDNYIAGISFLEEAGYVSESVENPGENGIAWYRFYATEETTLRFKANTECVVELFGPGGELMCRKSDDEAKEETSVSFDQNGPCFLAVHDFKPQKLSLSYSLLNAGKPDSGIESTAFEGDGNELENCYDLRGIRIDPGERRGKVIIRNSRKVIAR